MTDGLFVGFNAKLPEYQECKDSLMCKFAVKILGKNTNIQFYSFVKFSMAKVVGRIAKLPEGTNKGKFRLSKIELSMEVSHPVIHAFFLTQFSVDLYVMYVVYGRFGSYYFKQFYRERTNSV